MSLEYLDFVGAKSLYCIVKLSNLSKKFIGKEKTMNVRMKGNLLKKHIDSGGFKSLAKAAKKIECDARTLQRAINGLPVLLDTAMSICEGLELEPLDVIILDSETEPLDSTPDEQNDTELLYNEIVKKACFAAEDAICSILKSHDSYDYITYSTILAVLLSGYTLDNAQTGAPPPLHLIDDISRRSKKMVRNAISGGKSQDMTETE
ncbi:MAG: hypothetical protein OXG62_06715 [Nitrospinae bacterium]|nr:hypothetical protein [Nitrospinota bacterium]